MSEITWPYDAKRVISLCFDGVASADLDEITDQLSRLGRSATFFVDPTEVLQDLASWQKLVDLGHEIGNGCLFDVTDQGNLLNWTLRTVEQEVFMAQTFLDDFFPTVETQTFLYPGPNTESAQGSYRQIIESQYPFAVSNQPGINDHLTQLQWIKISDPGSSSAPGWHVIRTNSTDIFDNIDFKAAWVAPVETVANYLRGHR